MKKEIKKEETQTPPSEPTTPVLTAKEEKEVKVIERIIESKEIAPADAFGKMTRPQIQLIKRTVARNATDDELKMFIQVCKGTQLNPFLRQVHFVKRWDSKEGREVGAIQVGIDGFRSIAESSGAYAGNDDPIYDGEQEINIKNKYNESGKEDKKITVPLKATVTVYKAIQGMKATFTATARWEEYYPGAKIGFQWHIRPYLMLGKCAEALALRKAFPKLLSGMYAQEEMDMGKTETEEVKKLQTAYDKLKMAIDTATPEDLEKWETNLEKSDKYTDTQKKELKELMKTRKVIFGKELDEQK